MGGDGGRIGHDDRERIGHLGDRADRFADAQLVGLFGERHSRRDPACFDPVLEERVERRRGQRCRDDGDDRCGHGERGHRHSRRWTQPALSKQPADARDQTHRGDHVERRKHRQRITKELRGHQRVGHQQEDEEHPEQHVPALVSATHDFDQTRHGRGQNRSGA